MASRSTVLAVVVVLQLLGCFSLQASATNIDDVLCHDWQHHTFGGGISCCNHKTVHPGISENLDYHQWQDAPKDEKENLTASTWRVYTHLLSKSLPAGTKTISLTTFANIMSKNYPAKTKTDISKGVEKAKKDAKKKAFADAEIELTDYATINKMRVTYFGIEKLACGKFPKKTEKKAESPEMDMWNNCDSVEEMSHRDGGCCKNITLPFYDHHHQDAYHKFHPDTCNKTLAPLAKKLKITAAEDVDTLSGECQFTCFLLEKKHIKMEDVLGMKADSKMPTDKIVKLLAPIYLSKTTLKYMKDYVNQHFDMKKIMKEIPDTILGEKVKVDDILPCYAYDVVSNLIGNSLHEYCYPDEPHEDF